MTATIVAAISALSIHLLAFGRLWLRLRWRAKQQHGHRQYVVALARTLPAGSRIDDFHGI
ncbi:hypothetical protein [Nocardia sp. NPDC059239]|uniref:hypothetical protein n=1 Tax=Nocardia sp. NPDC059239 TaxID=3346785 RepID=UPI00367755EE